MAEHAAIPRKRLAARVCDHAAVIEPVEFILCMVGHIAKRIAVLQIITSKLLAL